MLKVKTTISVINDVDTKDFDDKYTTEDILQEFRETAFDAIDVAVSNDIANITTEVVNGS